MADNKKVSKIINNECGLSQYVIDKCIDKIRKGNEILIPGQPGVPKEIFIINKKSYYSNE